MVKIYIAKGDTLPDQFFDVGRMFGTTLRRESHKIGIKKTKRLRVRKLVAEKTLAHLRFHPLLSEFFACLESWSDGAGISELEAMWLLADNFSGCQTFMGRFSGGVALLHTEEDFVNIADRMTGEHTLAFRVDGQDLRCLVYNDLFPGAGLFGWQKDMLVAVDALFLKENDIENVERPLLVNIVAWLIWRMKPAEASPEHILNMIGDLGELVDGYAVNVVRRVAGKVEGFKLTLARSESRIEYLEDVVGAFISQVNIVDPNYPTMEWALPPRNLWKGGNRYFCQRLQTMQKHARDYQKIASGDTEKMKVTALHARIQETIFTDLREAYINNDVGAVCVGLIDRQATSVSTKLNNKEPVKTIEYIDVL